eukprot:COSAG04_NODE_672_length_11281_cov_16.794402_6_plen_317_part_00
MERLLSILRQPSAAPAAAAILSAVSSAAGFSSSGMLVDINSDEIADAVEAVFSSPSSPVHHLTTEDSANAPAAAAAAGAGAAAEEAGGPPSWLKDMHLYSHQVEVLFVLCTLLGGRHKQQAQDKLADLGLVPILSAMFDGQGWGPASASRCPRAGTRRPEGWGIHGEGCNCDPEGSLRTQLLRVVHNFLDRDGDNTRNKRLLLTRSELTSVGVGEGGSPDAPGQEGGLLSKLLDVLLSEPCDSKYRFWLSSCVESFLRGSHPAHQQFVYAPPSSFFSFFLSLSLSLSSLLSLSLSSVVRASDSTATCPTTARSVAC